MMNFQQLQAQLFALQDPEYRAFQCRLMPTIAPDRVIGIRTPQLRKFAQTFMKTGGAAEFLQALPHDYYEENNLHAFCIERLRDFDETIAALDAFLPYVDNWATCDMLRPKIFARHLPELLPHIRRWIASARCYTVRFGIGMLMSFYLDEAFQPEYLQWVSAVHREEYYVNMMIAWYFATALAKQYEQTIGYLERPVLDAWTHNKAIQKAIESNRITPEQKTYLRTLKRKIPNRQEVAE